MNVGSDRVFTRFIPAGAGNTARANVCSESSPVYPRWRGEHHAAVVYAVLNFGLSPLARGTQQAV